MQSVVFTNFYPDETLKKRFCLEPSQDSFYRCESEEIAIRGGSLKDYYKRGHFVGIKPKGFWPEAVFFDMDSTLIEEESGVILSERLGLQEIMAEMTKEAMEGKVPFTQSFRQRLRLLKGLSFNTIAEVFSQLHFHRGVSELCSWLHENRIPIYVISGGFSFFCEYIAQIIGATAWEANRVDIVNHQLTGEISAPLIGRKEKRLWFDKICQEHLINPAKTVMIGDGANDRDIMEASGLAIGFQAKEVLFPFIHVYNGTESHECLIDFFQEEVPYVI